MAQSSKSDVLQPNLVLLDTVPFHQVEGYSEVYDGNSMLFMDFRRHHSGLWAGTAPRCSLRRHACDVPCL